jgi:hypothetical protein
MIHSVPFFAFLTFVADVPSTCRRQELTFLLLVTLGPAANPGLGMVPRIFSFIERKRRHMDDVLFTRIISGVLLVIVLGFIIQRRRTRIR